MPGPGGPSPPGTPSTARLRARLLPMTTEALDHYDVAIAGAGLAGAALAIHLAKAGACVVVLDAASFPRPKLCGEFLSPEGVAALRRLGLGDVLAASGFQPIRVMRLTTPRGRILQAEIIAPDGLPGIGLSRSVLDAAMVEAARSAGAEVLERTRVVGPIIKDGRVVGLAARHGARGPLEVRSRLVIAADGRHSSLVRRTGTTFVRSRLRPRHFGLKRHLVVSEAGAAVDWPGTVALHLLPGGYVGTCRVEGALTNLCGLLPVAMSRVAHGDLDALAHEHFPRNPFLNAFWEAGRAAGPWKAVAEVRVECARPVLPGILYAGDCRGTVDPLGGQGMTMALLGAELLAPFALSALSRAGEGAGLRLSRRYERAWHRRFDRRIGLCRLFHHALVHPALIDAGLALGPLGPRLLAAAYGWTRDAEPCLAGPLVPTSVGAAAGRSWGASR